MATCSFLGLVSIICHLPYVMFLETPAASRVATERSNKRNQEPPYDLLERVDFKAISFASGCSYVTRVSQYRSGKFIGLLQKRNRKIDEGWSAESHMFLKTCLAKISAFMKYYSAYCGNYEPTFRETYRSHLKRSRSPRFWTWFLEFLILEDGVDRFSRNVGTNLPRYTA